MNATDFDVVCVRKWKYFKESMTGYFILIKKTIIFW
jgi:hypothetical protein